MKHICPNNSHWSLVKLQVCQRLGLEQLENRRAFIRPPTVATLLHVRGPLEVPLNSCVVRT